MASQPGKLLIYEEDVEFIQHAVSKYPHIETGGDLFGLWQSESTVVVKVVTGPGKNCQRTATSFFQDEEYLQRVGEHLTRRKGLCNIGEWHSHHHLNMPYPSHGDKSTIWRNMPQYGLERFLLIIATIQSGKVRFNGFIFTTTVHGKTSENMYEVETKILHGPSPYRQLPDVRAVCNNGVEVGCKQVEPTDRNSSNRESDTQFLLPKKKGKNKKKGKKSDEYGGHHIWKGDYEGPSKHSHKPTPSTHYKSSTTSRNDIQEPTIPPRHPRARASQKETYI